MYYLYVLQSKGLGFLNDIFETTPRIDVKEWKMDESKEHKDYLGHVIVKIAKNCLMAIDEILRNCEYYEELSEEQFEIDL